MAIRLTKTSKVVFALTIVLLSGALGYLIWRVNQEDNLDPDDSNAGESSWGICWYCCEPSSPPSTTCTSVGQSLGGGWYCDSSLLKYCKDGNDPNCTDGHSVQCGDGVWIPKPNDSSETGETLCPDCGRPAPGDIEPVIGECSLGSQCADKVHCIWPAVAYCASDNTCTCLSGSNNDCTDTSAQCSPTCPSGYEECSGAECVGDTIKAECYHDCASCNNRYWAEITCMAVTTNVCDSGAWVTRPTGTYTVGTDIPYSLTAQDSNGIDKASITSKLCTGSVASCTGGQSITPTTTGTTSPITISGTLTDLAVGTYTITFSWADSLGAVGSDCTLTTTFSFVEEESPGLNIVKSAVESCIDEGTDNPKSELVYTITVSNTGTGIGSVSQIEDVLDSKILAASIVPTDISSPGQYSNGKILWSFSPALSIPAGSSQVYSYKLVIEKANFGEYNNTVTLTPVTGDTIVATAEITADCLIEIPATGLFDTTLGRIATGILLLILGALVYNVPNSMFVVDRERKREMYMAGFEKKVANR